MAGFGRYILSVDLRNFLSRRSCLFNFSQNYRQSTTKQTEEIEVPEKPKKPIPSFFLYLQTVRLKLIDENPGIKVTEVIQRASKDWNSIDSTVKDGFKAQYNKNYEQYLQNMKEYKESLTDEQKEFLDKQKKRSKEQSAATNNRRKKDLFQRPKKPQNAFLLFLDSKRKIEKPRDDIKSWISDATKLWRMMPSEQKVNYCDQALKLMKQYKEDVIKWEQNMVNLGHPDIIRGGRVHKTRKEQQEK